MKHRPEIDGLRAIAVLPVVLLHAGFSLLPGGFVGVDVFFVISGFLITGIIADDLDRGEFRLLHFYERRARRILPALFVVILACVPFAWLLMLPDFLENFGQSMVATTVFANNILLTLTSGYWSLESDFKPLLHTWTLGVEEQYYVVFPLLMMAVWWRWRSSALGLAALVTAASLTLCVLLYDAHPNATFYLLHTRAWELLIGAGAILWSRARPMSGNDPAAWAGLAMIAASLALFDERTPFPSLYTLLPTVGTALVLLFARQGTRAAQVLSLSPLVGVGLISYSLYLWHQPVFAFVRIASETEPAAVVMAVATALAVLMAYLSWRFVEKPYRDASRIGLRTLILTLSVTAAAICVIGLVLARQGGFPSRFFEPAGGAFDTRPIAYNERAFGFKRDQFPQGEGPKLLVVGNSQARDFINAAIESGRFDGYRLVYRDDAGLCGYDGSPTFARGLFAEADYIVMMADEQICAADIRAAARAKNDRVVIIGPKHFGYNINYFVQIPRDERPGTMARALDEAIVLNRRWQAALPDLRYVDVLGAFSPDGTRLPIFDQTGQILSADRVHLTEAGGRVFGDRLFDDRAWRDFPAPTRSNGALKDQLIAP